MGRVLALLKNPYLIGGVVALALAFAGFVAVTLWEDHVAVQALIASSSSDKVDGKTKGVADRIVDDHNIIHTLAARELRRIQVEQQQQQALEATRTPRPSAVVPTSPPVASSPVPEKK